MSIDLILGLSGVLVTALVVVAGFLATPSNTEPAYDPERHPDGVDHGAPARGDGLARERIRD